MLRKLAEMEESKEEKYYDIDDNIKEVDINKSREVIETDNDKLVVNAANNATPHWDALTNTTTTAAATEEGWDDENVGGEDGDDNNKADYTKVGEEGGDIPQLKMETTKIKMMMTKMTTKSTWWTFYTP